MKTWLFQLVLFLSSSHSSGCDYECYPPSSNSIFNQWSCPSQTVNFKFAVFQTHVEENVLREFASMEEDRVLNSEGREFRDIL